MKLKKLGLNNILLIVFFSCLLYSSISSPLNRPENKSSVLLLNSQDFDVSKDQINYDLISNKDQKKSDEIRARIIGYTWGKNSGKKDLHPLSVSKGDENIKGWKNYLVLLSNEKGDNILKKVCFPNDLNSKVGLVLNQNKSCSKKIAKYDEIYPDHSLHFYDDDNFDPNKPSKDDQDENKIEDSDRDGDTETNENNRERKESNNLIEEPLNNNNYNHDNKHAKSKKFKNFEPVNYSPEKLDHKAKMQNGKIKDEIENESETSEENHKFVPHHKENISNNIMQNSLKKNKLESHTHDSHNKDNNNQFNMNMDKTNSNRNNNQEHHPSTKGNLYKNNMNNFNSQKNHANGNFGNQNPVTFTNNHSKITKKENTFNKDFNSPMLNNKRSNSESKFNTRNTINSPNSDFIGNKINTLVKKGQKISNTIQNNLPNPQLKSNIINNFNKVEVDNIGTNINNTNDQGQMNKKYKSKTSMNSSHEINMNQHNKLNRNNMNIKKQNNLNNKPNLKRSNIKSHNINEKENSNKNNGNQTKFKSPSNSRNKNLILSLKHENNENMHLNEELNNNLNENESNIQSGANHNFKDKSNTKMINFNKKNDNKENTQNNDQLNAVFDLQSDYLSNNNEISKNGFGKFPSSFLEISNKERMLSQISQRFSVEELKKMKSLIKFAKSNNLLEKIISKEGDISISDISKEKLIQNMTGIFKNFTDGFVQEREKINKEIENFKLVQIVQQAKMNSYFSEMNDNVNTMKQLMLFTKNFNTDFKNQILNFGSKLKDLNMQISSLEKRVNNLDHVANNLSLAQDKNKLESNNQMLIKILKNSTSEVLKNYQNLIKTEVFKLSESFKNVQGKEVSQIKSENIKDKIVSNKKEQKEEVKNENKEDVKQEIKVKKNSKKKNLKKKEVQIKKKEKKIKTEEIKANTFANEDAFDDVNPKLNLSTETETNKKNLGELDYSEKLW